MLEVSALHARWKVEDREGDALCNDEVVLRRRERCKDIARITFGHTVHDQQGARPAPSCQNGFGKSLIFQIFSFHVLSNRSVIILIPLELLHTRGYSTDG